jgi:hypothetical protein
MTKGKRTKGHNINLQTENERFSNTNHTNNGDGLMHSVIVSSSCSTSYAVLASTKQKSAEKSRFIHKKQRVSKRLDTTVIYLRNYKI